MKDKSFKTLFTLFKDYFKIGLFTFGGGLSMISLIQKTFVDKRGYITDDELLDITAISESTPGVIAVNTATYIGYKVGGILGSIFATIGVCIPSFLIILLISFFYEKFINIIYVKYFVKGLMIGVTYLLFNAAFKLFKFYKRTIYGYIILIISFVIIILNKFLDLNISSIYVILGSALLSIIIFLFESINKQKKEEIK